MLHWDDSPPASDARCAAGAHERASRAGAYWTARVGPAAAQEAAAFHTSSSAGACADAAEGSGAGGSSPGLPDPEKHSGDQAGGPPGAGKACVAVVPVPAHGPTAEAVEQLVGACLQNILRECAARPHAQMCSILGMPAMQDGSCLDLPV